MSYSRSRIVCISAAINKSFFVALCNGLYNPVKHGLVNSPLEWKHGSFRDFIEKGIYCENWGQSPVKELLRMDFE